MEDGPCIDDGVSGSRKDDNHGQNGDNIIAVQKCNSRPKGSGVKTSSDGTAVDNIFLLHHHHHYHYHS